MSQDKIKIATETDNPTYYWRPLMPIVEFCLEQGCTLDGKTPDRPFFEDRNGSNLCLIVGDVTVKDIVEVFSLPDHITVKKTSLYDTKNRSTIRITSFSEFEKVLEERKVYEEQRKKSLLESRKRRAERDALRLKQDGEQ